MRLTGLYRHWKEKMSTSRLCLGTAQFGLDYGVTNANGMVSINEIERILRIAIEEGIKEIDTASCYGSSEMRLGSLEVSKKFRLTSKLAKQRASFFDSETSIYWNKELSRSLERLGTNELDGLLVHCSMDLKKEGAEYLWSWLREQKDMGIVRRIGVSIYEGVELDDLNLRDIDIVQIPYSIYDQRAQRSGTIERLRDSGIRVVARSIYLQGLVLASSDNMPSWICTRDLERHKAFERYCEQMKITQLEAALSFVLSNKMIDMVVFGCCSSAEIEETVRSVNNLENINTSEMCAFGGDSVEFMDPRRWPIS